MKIYILMLLIVISSGCALPQSSIPGQTLVNGSPRLRMDAIRTVAIYEMALSPYKGPLPVLDTQLVQAPSQIGYERGTDLVQSK